MPVVVRKIGSKYRIVEASNNNIAMTNKDHPRDGGGHSSKEEAEKQARAINAGINKKRNWRYDHEQ